MSLSFFADHCVPTSIIQALTKAGYKVFVLSDYIPNNSDDSMVIGKSQELESILLSLNGDFSDIVSYPPSRVNYCWSNHTEFAFAKGAIVSTSLD